MRSTTTLNASICAHPFHVIRIDPDEAAYRTGSRRSQCWRSRLRSNRLSRVRPPAHGVATQCAASVPVCDHEREEDQCREYVHNVIHAVLRLPLLGLPCTPELPGLFHIRRLDKPSYRAHNDAGGRYKDCTKAARPLAGAPGIPFARWHYGADTLDFMSCRAPP